MRLLLYILILCLTVWAGIFLHKNPGNFELTYKDWIIDMPLWFPIIGGLILLFVLTTAFSVFSTVVMAYRRFKEWLLGSTLRSVMQNTNDAKIALIEGDWSYAETKILKAAKKSDYPLHCYLLAARAAQELGAIDRRDGYLHQALRIAPQAKTAILLTQAELQFEQGQYEYCLITMQELQKLAPSNGQFLKLAAQVYTQTGAWEEMANLLPQLNKHSIFPSEDFIALEIKTYSYLMQAEAKKAGVTGLNIFWENLPRHVRNHVEVVENYAQLLLSMQAFNEVEQVIRSQLKRQWDDKLVKLYGLALADPNKQISVAESWLKTHRDDPILLLTLARLCIAHKLWGKARNYLDASLNLEANPDAYAELGRLLSFLGESQKALECYKKGLLEYADVLPLEHAVK